MRSNEKRLTTVRLDDELFQEFKFQCIKDKFSFQKLASRSIFLYLTNKKFKEQIHKQTQIKIKSKNRFILIHPRFVSFFELQSQIQAQRIPNSVYLKG